MKGPARQPSEVQEAQLLVAPAGQADAAATAEAKEVEVAAMTLVAMRAGVSGEHA